MKKIAWLGDEWIVAPESLIRLALVYKLISPKEAASSKVKDAAQDYAEGIRDRWSEGSGVSSSDRTAFVRQMLRNAGFDVDWVKGQLTRKANKEEGQMKKAARDWVVSPDTLIRRALIYGLIDIEEANSREIKDAAQGVAERLKDDCREGEDVGSSDVNAFIKEMLLDAGIKADWVGGKLTRKAKTYDGILPDPVKNKELWHQIEEVAENFMGDADDSADLGGIAKDMAHKLAARYVRYYSDSILMGGEREKELADTILEYIWEEYHSSDRGRESSKASKEEGQMKKEAKVLLHIAKTMIADEPMDFIEPDAAIKAHARSALMMKLRVTPRDRQLFESFITKRNSTNNKFHYFGVWETKSTGEAIGGNSYGRIGYTPTSIEISRGNKSTVLRDVQKKEESKRGDGYRTEEI